MPDLEVSHEDEGITLSPHTDSAREFFHSRGLNTVTFDHETAEFLLRDANRAGLFIR